MKLIGEPTCKFVTKRGSIVKWRFSGISKFTDWNRSSCRGLMHWAGLILLPSDFPAFYPFTIRSFSPLIFSNLSFESEPLQSSGCCSFETPSSSFLCPCNEWVLFFLVWFWLNLDSLNVPGGVKLRYYLYILSNFKLM